MKLIIAHPHYRSLATLSERKAAWQRWRAARREEMEAEERAAVRQKKVDFVQMLKECSALSSRLRYKEARRELEGDARWDALENDYEREELYEEYTLSLERKEAAERRQQRRERMDAFRALLVRSQLAVGSQWRRVQVQLEDAPELRALEKIDRLAIFEEVIRGLEAEEEQRRQRAREASLLLTQETRFWAHSSPEPPNLGSPLWKPNLGSPILEAHFGSPLWRPTLTILEPIHSPILSPIRSPIHSPLLSPFLSPISSHSPHRILRICFTRHCPFSRMSRPTGGRSAAFATPSEHSSPRSTRRASFTQRANGLTWRCSSPRSPPSSLA